MYAVYVIFPSSTMDSGEVLRVSGEILGDMQLFGNQKFGRLVCRGSLIIVSLICEIYLDQHSCGKLSEEAMNFIVKNFQEISRGEEFLAMKLEEVFFLLSFFNIRKLWRYYDVL